MHIREELSGHNPQHGQKDFVIVADFPTREEIELSETYAAIEKAAAERGFSGGGLSGPPIICNIDTDGNEIPDDEVLNKSRQFGGFRAKYQFMRGLGSSL